MDYQTESVCILALFLMQGFITTLFSFLSNYSSNVCSVWFAPTISFHYCNASIGHWLQSKLNKKKLIYLSRGVADRRASQCFTRGACKLKRQCKNSKPRTLFRKNSPLTLFRCFKEAAFCDRNAAAVICTYSPYNRRPRNTLGHENKINTAF